MRAVAATTAILLLAPLNLGYVLAGLMLLVEVLNGPQHAVAAVMLVGLLCAYLPVFALNSLARRYVVGGIARVASIHTFWWVCALAFVIPVAIATAYAAFRLIGGQPYMPACAAQECPFGPGTSDSLLVGFCALPFAVPVVHLWLMRGRHMRSNNSFEPTR